MRGRDRQPVNAVHGYLDMTARLIERYRPDECVHVFDHDDACILHESARTIELPQRPVALRPAR